MSFEKVSSKKNKANKETPTVIPPIIKAALFTPKSGFKAANDAVSGIAAPLTKFGIEVATVALILVPKSSAAIIINRVQ